jgi:serine protease Do
VHFRLDDATPDDRGTTDREPVVFNGNLGLALRAPRADERRRSGVASGLVIAGVSPEAAQAGLQPGDLLLGIDSASVSTVADVTVAADRNHKPVALLVQRGGRKVYVPLRW